MISKECKKCKRHSESMNQSGYCPWCGYSKLQFTSLDLIVLFITGAALCGLLYLTFKGML